MRKEQIKEQHINWLQANCGVSFYEVEQMGDADLNKLSDELLSAECDALESGDDELTNLICQIEDIIFDEVPPEEQDDFGP